MARVVVGASRLSGRLGRRDAGITRDRAKLPAPTKSGHISLLGFADTSIEKSWYDGVDGLGDIAWGVRSESEPRSIPSWSPTSVIFDNLPCVWTSWFLSGSGYRA